SERSLSTAKAGAMSFERRISSVTTARPRLLAVASTWRISRRATGLSTLAKIANRARVGTASRKSSSRLPEVSVCWLDKPVTLPADGARPADRPPPPGAPPPGKQEGEDGCRFFGGRRRRGSRRKNDIDLEADELGCNLCESLAPSLRPAILYRDSAALNPA